MNEAELARIERENVEKAKKERESMKSKGLRLALNMLML